MSHLQKIQDIVKEMEEIIIEDNTNFEGGEEAVDAMRENILFYIEQKQHLLPDLKTFIKNKTDLYIMNGIDGAIYNDYNVVTIPKPLHIFRLQKVPHGVCNIDNLKIQNEIYNDLKYNIDKVYKSKTLSRQPIRKILQVLKTVQTKLFDINKGKNNFTHLSKYTEYKTYSQIEPKISEFTGGDTIINKVFTTTLTIKPARMHEEIIKKGQLLYKEKIHIITSDDKPEFDIFFDDELNLLEYLIPQITYTYTGTNYEWILMYSMQQIIDLLESNNIKRTIIIDLTCGNQLTHTNNIPTIMNKTAAKETRKYINFVNSKNRIRNTIRNKNYQPSK